MGCFTEALRIIGEVQSIQGKWTEAECSLKSSLSLLQDSLEDNHPDVGTGS
jgi:hypothetical protein